MTTWLVLTLTTALAAQDAPVPPAGSRPVVVTGQAALVGDLVPEQDARELRPRVSISLDAAPTSWSRVRFDARAEALVADRAGRRSGAVVRVTEAWIDLVGGAADVRAGVGRLVWGRLDEISPGDVVNPIDATRFLLEGRSEARLPVTFVRARVFPSEHVVVEGVVVPVFARGRFDELDEGTSPFNLVADAARAAGAARSSAEPVHVEPATSWRNMSGGGRVQVTVGRVDLAGSAFRGFEGFGPITLDVEPPAGALPGVNGRLVEHHTPYTMVAADFETVSGAWAWRGEVVGTVERTFAGRSVPGLVGGRSLDAGVGFDRRAGDFRVYSSLVIHRDWSAEDNGIDRTDVNVVGSAERPFARGRYLARGFVVVNPADGSAFVRGLVTWKASDRASVEASAGTFVGTSDDRIGQFRDRDFAVLRLRYDF